MFVSRSYIALPARFQRYDLNGDGFVTALELSDATGTDLEDSAKPFRVADLDGTFLGKTPAIGR